jgi:hypothetical protein
MKNSGKIAGYLALMRSYQPKGIVLGGELLLKPKDALDLIDELEAIGIAIWGIDTWFYWEPDTKQRLAEDVGRDINVPDAIMASPEAIKMSASMARDFIQHHLTERTAYVSVFPEDAYVNTKPFSEEQGPDIANKD